MYVVRRAFRNYGQMMAPGSIVEPGAVKRFKSRLNDGHIVDVNEQDIEKWKKYFKERIGVELIVPVPELPELPEVPAHHGDMGATKPAAPEKIAKVVKPATAKAR